MVSTRALKLKFYEGERVLCYEPDPTKAKVLYDSKVLDIVINKDHRGRKNIEYLIHFQGWNSSWDRCVREEYVLKDTPENRQLQKDLAEKAQLQLGAYLYRRERKKHTRKINEPIAPLSEDGSSGSPAQLDTEDSSSNSEEDSSVEDEAVPIELTSDLRNILEQDYNIINNRGKLMKLPTEPTVVAILEMYWRHYATTLLCSINDKTHSRYRTSVKARPEDVQKNLSLCKEMLDGLRIYFDFTLKDLLLYKNEQNQIQTDHAKFLSSVPALKQEISVKTELEDLEYAHLPNIESEEDLGFSNLGRDQSHSNSRQRIVTRRRGLRSTRSTDAIENNCSNNPGTTPKSNSENVEVSGPMPKILAWRLLPEHVYTQPILPPSLVYGATHLLRLLVKLPELLCACNMMENKLKVLQKHLDSFIDFLNCHKEWYGEKYYMD